jgi:hypothetical protein
VFDNRVLRRIFGPICCEGDKIKEDEMGEACSAYGRDDKCIQNFSWKDVGRWEDNTKMDLRDIG